MCNHSHRKTVDLMVLELNNFLDDNHDSQKEGKTQKIIASRTQESFTRSGLMLVSEHQRPPYTDVFGTEATAYAFLMSNYTQMKDNILPALRSKRTRLLIAGPLYR